MFLIRKLFVAITLVLVLIAFVLVISIACYMLFAPSVCVGAHEQIRQNIATSTELTSIPGYVRGGETTYLTFPEWYIVWSSEEYATFVNGGGWPSQFPFFHSIAQFWCGFDRVHQATKDTFAFNQPEYIALGVIGTSYSAEYIVRGLYEGTIGRASEFFSGGEPTSEDLYARAVAKDYGTFLHEIPFYDYPFGEKFVGLWRSTPLYEKHPIRAWERKLALSLEYGIKAGYGWLIRTGTHAAYKPAPQEVYLQIRGTIPAAFAQAHEIRSIKVLSDGTRVIAVPSYQKFNDTIVALSGSGIAIENIAGHDDIVMSVIMPMAIQKAKFFSLELFEEPILTVPIEKRMILVVPVKQIYPVLKEVQENGGRLEHIYDYI